MFLLSHPSYSLLSIVLILDRVLGTIYSSLCGFLPVFSHFLLLFLSFLFSDVLSLHVFSFKSETSFQRTDGKIKYRKLKCRQVFSSSFLNVILMCKCRFNKNAHCLDISTFYYDNHEVPKNEKVCPVLRNIV
jgi:hypothetical protein